MKTQALRDSSDSNYNKHASPIVPRHDFPPAHEWALTGKSGYCSAFIKMRVLTTRSHVVTEAERTIYREQPTGAAACIPGVNAKPGSS